MDAADAKEAVLAFVPGDGRENAGSGRVESGGVGPVRGLEMGSCPVGIDQSLVGAHAAQGEIAQPHPGAKRAAAEGDELSPCGQIFRRLKCLREFAEPGVVDVLESGGDSDHGIFRADPCDDSSDRGLARKLAEDCT